MKRSNKTLQATADGALRSFFWGCFAFPFRSSVASAAVPELALGRSSGVRRPILLHNGATFETSGGSLVI
jgi:hypothetical protein